jgi:uncharacterized damage-inducible protein DinB
MEDVTPPEPPERDWYELVAAGGPCPDCGLDVGAIRRSDLGPSVMGEARAWEEFLEDVDDKAARRRPEPETWSALEYACHVAGVFDVFAGRVRRMRQEDEPELGWWDHEAAVTEEEYNERSLDDARTGIADGAVALALALPRLDDPAQWERFGTRRSGERFTVEGLVRFAIHESNHHRRDARTSARG